MLWGVNELDGLGFVPPAPDVIGSGIGRWFEGGGRRCSLEPSTGYTGYFFTPDFAPISDFWAHLTIFLEGSGTENNAIIQARGATGDVARVLKLSNHTFRIDYWNGSTWVVVGTSFALSTFSLYTVDMRVQTGGGNITVSMWVDQTKIVEQTYAYAAEAVTHVRNYGFYNSTSRELSFSEFIWGDQPTIGCRVLVGVPTAEGFHTDGDTTHTTVDENGVPNDGDVNSLFVAGEKQNFTHNALSVPAGLVVKSVCLGVRAARSATGPQNVRPFLRKGGTDYAHPSNFTDIDVGQGPHVAAWDTDPSTAVAWENADAVSTALEFGIEALA